jgi:signal transduction histidine kinase
MDVQLGPRNGEPVSAILVSTRWPAGEDLVIAVRLSASATGLVLRIADDGRGMSVLGRGVGKAEGVGIPGMRVHLRQLGGDLEILSTSSGTLISACVPMTRVAQKDGRIRSDVRRLTGCR